MEESEELVMRRGGVEQTCAGDVDMTDSWVKSWLKRKCASPPKERANKMTLGALGQMIMSLMQKKQRTREEKNHGRRGRRESGDDRLDPQSQTLPKAWVGCERALRKNRERSLAPEQWGQEARCS